MNKMMKGSVAGATGIALLMGGFGTYALWSDSEQLAQNSVQSGELSIDTSAGVYDDTRTTTVGDWSTSEKMVPGDVITYTQKFTVKGNGRNLKGDIALASLGSLGTNDFANALVRTVEVTSDNTTEITRNADKVSFSFEKPFGTAELTAVVTYTFPAGTAGSTSNTTQNHTATTPAANFVISQR